MLYVATCVSSVRGILGFVEHQFFELQCYLLCVILDKMTAPHTPCPVTFQDDNPQFYRFFLLVNSGGGVKGRAAWQIGQGGIFNKDIPPNQHVLIQVESRMTALRWSHDWNTFISLPKCVRNSLPPPCICYWHSQCGVSWNHQNESSLSGDLFLLFTARVFFAIECLQ